MWRVSHGGMPQAAPALRGGLASRRIASACRHAGQHVPTYVQSLHQRAGRAGMHAEAVQDDLRAEVHIARACAVGGGEEAAAEEEVVADVDAGGEVGLVTAVTTTAATRL